MLRKAKFSQNHRKEERAPSPGDHRETELPGPCSSEGKHCGPVASRAAQLLSSGLDFLTHINCQPRRLLVLASICKLRSNTSLGIVIYCLSHEDAGVMGAQCLGGLVVDDTC